MSNKVESSNLSNPKQDSLKKAILRFYDWAEKCSEALKESTQNRLASNLLTNCRYLISWGMKTESRDEAYYSKHISKIENELLKKTIQAFNLFSQQTVDNINKHGPHTKIRQKKIMSTLYEINSYILPLIRRLNANWSILEHSKQIRKFATELIQNVQRLDDDELENLTNMITKMNEIGAKFSENLILVLKEENMKRTFSENVARDLEEGESSTVEFKLQFPKNAREIAEIIASFASSGEGRIYLGVNDSGKPCGLDMTGTSKDEISNRISQMALNTVDPPIQVDTEFFSAESMICAKINVPKGPEPIYFVNGTAYIRDSGRTIPANSTQIKQKYKEYFLNRIREL